ncbi:superinfection immunity protein [Chryseobacterium arthrosphaerae]|uniref:superinfection immunity protein n=2 Tax=Chryseobacterium arthrosphaerae TaxID=651561 RepID=UPI001F4A9F2F|nr:superinfection immunity protein [Chryseobacterium arthrosphaerae]
MKNKTVLNQSNIETDSYKFEATRDLYIRNVPDEIDNKCYTQGEIWQWPHASYIYTLDWREFKLARELKELLKGYLFHRLQTKSTGSIASLDLPLISYLSKNIGVYSGAHCIDKILKNLKDERVIRSLKFFYKWCMDQDIIDFNEETYKKISSIKLKCEPPYKKIYLRQNYIKDSEIKAISKKLEPTVNEFITINNLQSRVLLRICMELAPRPSQIYALNNNDLIVFNDKNRKYFALQLPMVKKMNQKTNGYRIRAISQLLASEIELLVRKNNRYKVNSLFVSTHSQRRTITSLIDMIKNSNKSGLTSTDFRHYLAQSLADQGASIEVIADILGHNSTFAARALTFLFAKAQPDGSLFLKIILFIYFIPTIIALFRSPVIKSKFFIVLFVNTLLGWTLFGWWFAFYKAFSSK